MNIFFNILQRSIYSVKDNIIYPSKPQHDLAFFLQGNNNNNSNISVYLHIIMYEIYCDVQKRKTKYINKLRSKTNPTYNFTIAKFAALNKVLNNDFISNELKDQIFAAFSMAQRHYFSLNRFLNIYKYKRFPIVVTNDLSLNPLEPEGHQTFFILQNKSLYLFLLRDLINIIENALCNAPNFFALPLSPKNPYNNEIFTPSIMYNIYFKMKDNICLQSTVFHMFFLDHFNKIAFSDNNEALIRDIAINKFVLNTPAESLYHPILSMLTTNFYMRQLKIADTFPKELLAQIFRPFLLQYYNIHFSLKGFSFKNKCTHELNIKFKKFQMFNPIFGRKFIKGVRRRKPNRAKMSCTFNSKCISFHNICIKSYLNNSDSEDEENDTATSEEDDEGDEEDDNYDF